MVLYLCDTVSEARSTYRYNCTPSESKFLMTAGVLGTAGYAGLRSWGGIGAGSFIHRHTATPRRHALTTHTSTQPLHSKLAKYIQRDEGREHLVCCLFMSVFIRTTAHSQPQDETKSRDPTPTIGCYQLLLSAKSDVVSDARNDEGCKLAR